MIVHCPVDVIDTATNLVITTVLISRALGQRHLVHAGWTLRIYRELFPGRSGRD